MVKIACFIILLLCGVSSYAQNQVAINRRQGRIALDNSKGFGNFVFGSPPKLDKSFKRVRDANEEPSKKYFSKRPVTYHGIQIDSVYLSFFKNKLYSIMMYISKSNIQQFISYCNRSYGPVGRDIEDDDRIRLWRGKKKRIVFYERENKVNEVLFIDNTDLNDRIELSAADTVAVCLEHEDHFFKQYFGHLDLTEHGIDDGDEAIVKTALPRRTKKMYMDNINYPRQFSFNTVPIVQMFQF